VLIAVPALSTGIDVAAKTGSAAVVPAGVDCPQREVQVRAESSGPAESCAWRQQQEAPLALVRQQAVICWGE
jgi:hypothetical protein